jgi:hypothetical protein
VFSIVCRYADANDSARLGADPIHKMLLNRDPDQNKSSYSAPCSLAKIQEGGGKPSSVPGTSNHSHDSETDGYVGDWQGRVK